MSNKPVNITRVAKAIRVLRSHHSASTLPAKAVTLLKAMPGAMPWRCSCGRLNKQSAVYCRKCGSPWWETGEEEAQQPYQAQDVGVPWRGNQDTWDGHPKRDRSLSRRRARKGMPNGVAKGAPKGVPKGAFKGGKPAESAMPGLPALPTPPKAVAVQHPPTSAGVSAGPSVALLTALQTKKGNLPPEVLHAIEGIAMRLQSKAKQELARLGAQRLNACTAWAAYLQEVTETVAKQMQIHEKGLKDIEAAETSWRESLQNAAADLARMSEKPVDDDDAEDMSVEAVKAWALVAAKRRQEHMEQQQQLMLSLREASQTAASMANAAQRDTSRTPRRKRPAREGETEGMNASSPELMKSEAAKAKTEEEKLSATLGELSGKQAFA